MDTLKLQVVADVLLSDTALSALAAWQVGFDGNLVTDREAGHVFAYRHHRSAAFVPHDAWQLDPGTPGPSIPLVDVKIGTAKRCSGDLQKHLVGCRLGNGHYLNFAWEPP